MVDHKEHESSLLVDSLQKNISQEAAPLLNFVLKHVKAIAFGLVLLTGTIAGFGIYNYVHEGNIAKAQETLTELTSAPLNEAQLAKLKKFAETSPVQVRPAALLALAKASLRAENYASAVDAWGTLQALNIESMRDIAGLGKADAYARMGDYKKAQEVLTQMLSSASEAYRLPAKHQLAMMAEKSGDVKTSITLYKELESVVPPANKAFYSHKIAMLNLKLKN
ncbi:tetratricopeptide repeat protein [Halodesulfovibrio sp.]|uniref:tetratricopeptide repeat protein n=1 Tax=Halodesulfovibrio sp. TaxID=1912772 RepID=UPI0025ED9811|nr:tetratricopeptide repeat protein [Halodesulfovibrio sp.]MCT4534437.1 hypothetical protein [Halodesulfovibrio sp.]MCT4627267.1 hypothetical protein [Halodesulfovibrio sp.]